MDAKEFTLDLTLKQDYEFTVRFDQPEDFELVLDEPPPLGNGVAPNAARLVAAAVGNCLSASLLYCLRKARVEVEGLKTTVHGTLIRNERGRFRIGGIRVRLEPSVDPGDRDRMKRCLEIFEDFCIVTESVRQGIDVDVDVLVPAAAG